MTFHSVVLTVVVQHVCNLRFRGFDFLTNFFFNIQGVSRLVDITAGGDFLGLFDPKCSYKHVSDFGRLRSYDRFKLRIEGNNY